MENQKQLEEEVRWISNVQGQLQQLVDSPELPDHLRPKREYDLRMSTAIKQRLNGLSTPSKFKLHQKFIYAYWDFYLKEVRLKPKLDKGSGLHMNKIIKYLVDNCPENTEENALELWKLILDNWNNLNSSYLRGRKGLKYISADIDEITGKLRNGERAEKKGADRYSDLESEFARK